MGRNAIPDREGTASGACGSHSRAWSRAISASVVNASGAALSSADPETIRPSNLGLEIRTCRSHLSLKPVASSLTGSGHDAEAMTPDVRASFRRGRYFLQGAGLLTPCSHDKSAGLMPALSQSPTDAGAIQRRPVSGPDRSGLLSLSCPPNGVSSPLSVSSTYSRPLFVASRA